MRLLLLVGCIDRAIDLPWNETGGGLAADTADSGGETGAPPDSGERSDSGEPEDTPPADTGVDTGTEPGLVVDEDVLRRLADRLAEVQNDDGSWDWQRGLDEGLTPEETGYQNVTGVTALGFFPTMDRLGEGWQGSVDATVAYFEPRLEALAADPDDTDALLSSPTWTFLARHLERHPDAELQADAEAALDALAARRDELHGTDPDARMDGWTNYNIERRTGIEGILPWDLALLAEALHAMGREVEHAETCTILATYLESTFLPAWEADPALLWGDISIALPLYVLVDCPDASPDLLATLDAELDALVHEDGSVGNGSEDDGPHQGTAYGLLALKRRGSEHASRVQAHLEARVGEDGILDDGGTALETYEIEGEVLRALAE